MKDRFLFAILLSIGLHLLLLEIVAALDILPSASVRIHEIAVVPVMLLDGDGLPAPPSAPGSRVAVGGAGQASGQAGHPDRPARSEPAISRKAIAKVQTAPTVGVAGLTERRDPGDALLSQNAELCVPVPTPGAAPSGFDAAGADAEPVNAATGAGSGVGNGAEGAGPVDLASGQGAILVSAEHFADNPLPRYPFLARRKGWEGTVYIAVRVGERGLVREARIEKSSGYDILDRAALDAVRNWCLGTGGRPDQADLIFRIPVTFKLRES